MVQDVIKDPEELQTLQGRLVIANPSLLDGWEVDLTVVRDRNKEIKIGWYFGDVLHVIMSEAADVSWLVPSVVSAKFSPFGDIVFERTITSW